NTPASRCGSARTRWSPRCAVRSAGPSSPPAPTWPVRRHPRAARRWIRRCSPSSMAASAARPGAAGAPATSAMPAPARCCAGPESDRTRRPRRLGPARSTPENAAMRASAALLLASALAACGLAGPAAAQDSFKVYRCTSDDGRVALRDSPCPDGQAQEVRTMRTPRDAPPRPELEAAEPAAPAPAAAPPVVERTVVLRTPQPMCECTTPDGDRYTSDSPAGNPRWVPLWTLGYPPPVPRGTRPPLAITGGTVEIRQEGTTLRRPGVGPAWMAGAGTWIRDTCH